MQERIPMKLRARHCECSILCLLFCIFFGLLWCQDHSRYWLKLFLDKKHHILPTRDSIMCVCVPLLCHVHLIAIPWTAAHQVLVSMWFPRQEYWSSLLFPSLGDLLDPGINPHFLHCRRILYHWATWEVPRFNYTTGQIRYPVKFIHSFSTNRSIFIECLRYGILDWGCKHIKPLL